MVFSRKVLELEKVRNISSRKGLNSPSASKFLDGSIFSLRHDQSAKRNNN